MLRTSLLAVLVATVSLPVSAQDPKPDTRQAGLIRSQASADVLPLEAVAFTEVERVNLDEVIKEDLQREVEGLAPRFAIPTVVDITPANHGTWEDLDGERLLWRLRVRGFGAKNLNLGFGSYRMPAGGELWIYSSDLRHVVRPFTSADNETHGELWTPVVATDELVVEVVIPRRVVDELQLKLVQIGYGYRGFKSTPPSPSSGSCNYDVICPEGDNWRLDIPSVGVISLGGGTFCTGYMVNNARTDLAPYFMTAFHCGVNSGNASSLVVYWNYDNTTCRVPGSTASGGPGDGLLNQFNTGSFFRAEYSPSDVTLVLLDDDPDPAFDVSFAGWDNSGAEATTAIAIHHPNTDEKRISFEFESTTTTSYLGEAIPGDGTHVRIIDWDLGTTEPGSSGSPVFDQDHRVIGQLHGGFASCTSQTSDWYGRFSVSWTGGGTNATRLSNWLDPDNTGVTFVDTISLNTLCTDEGEILLGQGRYACEDTISIRVVDCGPNTNPLAIDTVQVLADSNSEPGGELLTLNETSVSSGRFEGSLPISGTNGTGVLLVASGDTISVDYLDSDNGMGGTNLTVTVTAAVDCAPPLIQSVTILDVGPGNAVVQVNADEPITAIADYGSACGAYTQSAMGEGLSTLNTVELTGLVPNTTYFFRAGGIDEAGNSATDDNGGNCFTVTTDDVPNYTTEEFLGDFDLADSVWLFKPVGGEYEICARGSSTSLPSDPAGGTVLAMSDDDSEQISLADGKMVRFHGQLYSSFYVGSNGNITFQGPDTDFTESLDEHFNQPRISVLWDDFNPSSAGTVSWIQHANRVTVSWEGVPEFSTSNSNTFQADLFFDGRIRLSYTTVDSTDSIVGMSAGNGLDPLYFESDISVSPTCPPPGGRFLRRSAAPEATVSIQR